MKIVTVRDFDNFVNRLKEVVVSKYVEINDDFSSSSFINLVEKEINEQRTSTVKSRLDIDYSLTLHGSVLLKAGILHSVIEEELKAITQLIALELSVYDTDIWMNVDDLELKKAATKIARRTIMGILKQPGGELVANFEEGIPSIVFPPDVLYADAEKEIFEAALKYVTARIKNVTTMIAA